MGEVVQLHQDGKQEMIDALELLVEAVKEGKVSGVFLMTFDEDLEWDTVGLISSSDISDAELVHGLESAKLHLLNDEG